MSETEIRPEKFAETLLWKTYAKKTDHEQFWERRNRTYNLVKDVSQHLNRHIPDTFPNYTLHDGTHITNVMFAMGGLLGDRIDSLSMAECELLIWSAALHDIGMVYFTEDIDKVSSENKWLNNFLKNKYPDYYAIKYEELPQNVQQDYLRDLHPFRIQDALDKVDWNNDNPIEDYPIEMPSLELIISVCQAHGEYINEIRDNKSFHYQNTITADPLFCVILLRLADLLDFDCTRAPKVLFSYAKNNKVSAREWLKHGSSKGFAFPETPSNEPLPYSATCDHPNIEQAIYAYLDWIDDELRDCRYLLENCHARWKNHLFPKEVLRTDISTKNFQKGVFKLSIDQDKIISLLTGENLYDKKDVFVRELLQNAVDAVLLRSKIDHSFSLKDAHIDMCEWTDSNGTYWFRIDDNGTGMTLSIIRKYLLKAGSSYYLSEDIKKDLCERGCNPEYRGISKFGIGFLSCFLAGTSIRISTLYFDDDKSKRDSYKTDRFSKYGLILDIEKNDNYYKVRNQAEKHKGENIACPPFNKINSYTDDDGYRKTPGTTILIKLDPSQLIDCSLEKIARQTVFGTRIPITFNGKAIGENYHDIVSKMSINCSEIMSLSEEEKTVFDYNFDFLYGKYPTIIHNVCSLDFHNKDNDFGFFGFIEEFSYNTPDATYLIDDKPHSFLSSYWSEGLKLELIDHISSDETKPLISIKDDSPIPYRYHEWSCKFNYLSNINSIIISYNGLVQQNLKQESSSPFRMFLLSEGKFRPEMNVARSGINSYPLEIELAISYMLFTHAHHNDGVRYNMFPSIRLFTLREWYSIIDSEFGEYMYSLIEKTGIFDRLLSNNNSHNREDILFFGLLGDFTKACIQKKYECTLEFPIVDRTSTDSYFILPNMNLSEKKDEAYLDCPPLLFCKPANSYSSKFISASSPINRYGFNSEHPFINWLIRNESKLKKYFFNDYNDLIRALKNEYPSCIISVVKKIQKHINTFRQLYNIDIETLMDITARDFWDN